MHDCAEILADVAALWGDLRDTPLGDGDLVWFTDGSSYVADGQRRAGAAVVDASGKVIWADALPAGISAQKAELITLAQALEMAKGQRVTIYTDSHYAFGTVHIQGPIYRERGFLTAEGKEIKNLSEIRRFLAAIHLPQAVAIVHTPGHQKGENIEARGNRAADGAAQKAATEGYDARALTVGLPAPGMGALPPIPEYSPLDREWIQAKGVGPEDPDGWYRDSAGNLLLTSDLGWHLCSHLHQTTHLGEKNIASLLQTARLRFPRQKVIVQEITHSCKACQMMAPGKKKGQHTGIRYRRIRPGQHWEIDFTEVRPG
ncbi:uncharacterized protein LOC129561812 isoform X2 [Moschus berezovskii]|uniref:uncharacterized protein LOC129561812 isoform X2 n=1 Tax=Moschus berezovskii TaxID=68408 RepID=UPI002444C629|nr:uncharacterized protein LOC129561812 isoform X2 [Moschus berezovskii]